METSVDIRCVVRPPLRNLMIFNSVHLVLSQLTICVQQKQYIAALV